MTVFEYALHLSCQRCSVKPNDALKKTRFKHMVQARQIAHWLLKKHTKYSLAEIGWEIGGKDHSTVLHSVKTVNNLIDTEFKYRAMVYVLEFKFIGYLRSIKEPTDKQTSLEILMLKIQKITNKLTLKKAYYASRTIQ